MDQAALVGMLQAERRLSNVMGGSDWVHGPVFADNLLQIRAVHVLHDQKVQLAVLVDVMGADDVRMVERSDRLSFLIEPVQEPAAFSQRNGQDLDRDAAAQGLVLCQIDDAHASKSQPFQNLVFANGKAAPFAAKKLLGLENSQDAVANELTG